MKKRTKNSRGLSKYVPSALLFLLFEAVAVTLWLTKDNLFYLLNFSYIGACLGLGTALFTAGKRYARHFVQLAVGSYMLLYLGVISQENMQIEGFWYYLFLGVFEAATIHYAVAKIFGPLLFGRGWCGYACWTAMVLDFLPYKQPQKPRKKRLGILRYVMFALSLALVSGLFLMKAAHLAEKRDRVHPLLRMHEGLPHKGAALRAGLLGRGGTLRRITRDPLHAASAG